MKKLILNLKMFILGMLVLASCADADLEVEPVQIQDVESSINGIEGISGDLSVYPGSIMTYTYRTSSPLNPAAFGWSTTGKISPMPNSQVDENGMSTVQMYFDPGFTGGSIKCRALNSPWSIGTSIDISSSYTFVPQPCDFDYDQGFNVGAVLGATETYLREHYDEYYATITDPSFTFCPMYVAGVNEGYNHNNWPRAWDSCLTAWECGYTEPNDCKFDENGDWVCQ